MKNIAVLISGGGTNLQALLDAQARGEFKRARVTLVIADRKSAGGIARAEAAGVETAFIPRKKQDRLIDILSEHAIDLIVLSGYLSILPPEVIASYRGRIINIHPALTPLFSGMGFYGLKVHKAVLASGMKVTGATVHYADEGVDTGAIITQRAVPVMPGDTPEILQARVLETEHLLLVETVKSLTEENTRRVPMPKRAVISVNNKENIVPLAQKLHALGYELVSTGGTAQLLTENGLPVTLVENVTGFPECLDGRVKTLHPRVFAGILAVRGNEEHESTLAENGIIPVDIVISNLYPFAETIAKPGCTLADAIENIDIGGPSMIRAAAKNYKSVAVITGIDQYDELVRRLAEDANDEAYRLALAVRAFNHTAAYDARIAGYLNDVTGIEYPDTLTFTFNKHSAMRYGENPSQSAAFYVQDGEAAHGIESAKFLHGKELSYNNIGDTQGAIALIKEFDETACAAIKHASPCGVGMGATVYEAFMNAYECDPQSIFGGIIAFNRPVDKPTAEKMKELFLEVIVAPAFTTEARAVLQKKKNLRLLELPEITQKPANAYEFKSAGGGLLIQQSDYTDISAETRTVVTKATPTAAEMKDLIFAMKVVRYVKSNAIVAAKDGKTLGIGGGQVSRIWAAEAAIGHALSPLTGAVLASDAYFPFPDVVEACAKAGVTAIIQPGGSKNDAASIEACDRLGIAMVFTGCRHFKH